MVSEGGTVINALLPKGEKGMARGTMGRWSGHGLLRGGVGFRPEKSTTCGKGKAVSASAREKGKGRKV